MAETVSAVTESGIWETIAGCNAPPPSYDAQMIALASASVGIEVYARPKSGLVNSLKSELRDLVFEGLGAQTNDEWLAFWNRDRFVAFHRLTASLLSAIDAAYATSEERKQVIERGNAACFSKIGSRLSQFVGHIDEADSRIREAYTIVSNFGTLSDPKVRSVDIDCAHLHAGAIAWYSIAINSLTVASEQDGAPGSLIKLLVDMVTGGSKLALRTAKHAAALRAVQPDEHLVLTASIAAADDGFGYVAAINELQVETCSETQHEMRRLIPAAVLGYFEAEKARGGLSDALSWLQLNRSPSQLLVSLYVRDGGEPHLSDMLKVKL